MSDPCISAIIPNFNHAKFLPRVVASYLNQPVLPAEIFLMDDASTDNSIEVMEQLAREHPLIRVVRNEKNMGCNATMNRGMELAKCDYVIFTAADDEVRPGVIELHARMLRAHPQASLSSGICEWRCTTTGMSWLNGGAMPNQECYLSPEDMVALSKRGRLAINNQNTVYKKAALQEAGGWIPELHWFADWFADCAVGFRYGMCHVPEVLSNFYLQPGSYYNARSRNYAERRAVMARMLELFDSDRFVDVAPLVRKSGFMGVFGWTMMRVILARPGQWKNLTPAFARLAGKRCAEVVGRRFLPDWLARWSLKTFYGRREPA
jgi:glycosyltransferase involved in cell wall biosynthesis